MGHTYDFKTDFCTRCGAGWQMVVDLKLECVPEGSNVVGVSHLIAARRMKQLLEKVAKK